MIDPRFMSVTQWTDAVNLILATSAPPHKVYGEDWQEWAYNMVSIPSISRFSPPNPRSFSDWRTWAERFVECVPL